jgi:hypothetical protein
VHLHQVFLLRGGEFRLFAAESSFRFRDLHTFASSGADQVGLELSDHGEHVEQQSAHWVVGIVDGSSDAELHVFGGELVNDVFRIPERAREAVEFGNNQRVAGSACGEGFSTTRHGPVGSGEAMVGVDQCRSNAQSFEGVLLGGEILFIRGHACVSDQ